MISVIKCPLREWRLDGYIVFVISRDAYFYFVNVQTKGLQNDHVLANPLKRRHDDISFNTSKNRTR